MLQLYRQHGDLKILARLYQPYMELVLAVCCKYLEHREAARDAVMEIFEELVVKLRRHEVSNFRSWLYTVARNHCLLSLRSVRGRQVEFSEQHMQSATELHPLDSVWEREQSFEQLQRCLDKLSPQHKSSIELFYLQGKCYKEISEISGLAWNQVRSYIQNARRNLKICMENARTGNGKMTAAQPVVKAKKDG